MEQYDPNSNIDRGERTVGVSDFINYELSHFNTYNCARSIPNIMDDNKPSQRKIMFVVLKHLVKNEMKVAQFAPLVFQLTDYHHGEQSLMGAIILMTQNFVSSNNINLLLPLGGFSTRLNSSNSASLRYIFTKLNPIALKLFDPCVTCLLNHLESDGTSIEPEWYAPILPIILVNGTLSIGTGFSTSVLQYNSIDIANYIKVMLTRSKPAKDLVPWYESFTGRIEKTLSGKYTTYRAWEFIDKKRCLHVNNLPIGLRTDNYEAFCEKMLIQNGSPLADVQYDNTDAIVDFKLGQ